MVYRDAKKPQPSRPALRLAGRCAGTGITMLSFTPVTENCLPLLRRYYAACTYRLCEYSALMKLMLRTSMPSEWAEATGCLVVRTLLYGRYYYDYPVPGPAGNVDGALYAIERWCAERGEQLSFFVVPAAQAPGLLSRYPRFHVTKLRSWSDYLYRVEDLRGYPGRRYSGRRNHVNKFCKLYPEAVFRPLDQSCAALMEQFWHEYDQQFSKRSEQARDELRNAKEMLRLLAGDSDFCAGGMELNGKLLSLSMAERCGDTLHIHIEKALYSYEGVYPAAVQAFVQRFAGEGIKWINREDDCNEKGLRTSKLQYLPAELLEKYCVDVENELYALDSVPTLTTPRLTLSALTEADRSAYNALCRDDARNRYWGYDYREDWKGEPLEEYFLNVARQDFARHVALNFAVRLGEQLIGEVVFYRFDGRGGAELGCRIAPDYAHQSYGTEAFAAAAEWGLYGLNLSHVVARCYRENAASLRMLSSCMRRDREDETFYYFNKVV